MTRLSLLLLGLMFPVLGAWGAERPVVTLDDPTGDDNGNGALVYPQRTDLQRGDLDLVLLRMVRIDGGYRFEASFKNPIRDPESVAGDVGPESLSYFARRGFYAFNLDIYIDQDRVNGSGNTYTLPGRHLTIAPSHAWEKAIILTPRPELMQKQLINAVAESVSARNPDEVTTRIDHSILFPTEVSVRHRTVAFNVPEEFLSGGRPDTDWSIMAFVTGAMTSVPADFSLLSSSDTAIERLSLGVLQPKPGQPRDTFGYTSVVAPNPIVDLLAPAPLNQQELLSGTTELVGVTWTTSDVATTATNAKPVTSITSMVAPQQAAPASTGSQSTSVAERLQQLNELRDQGLVTDQEYEELRRKILADL